MLFGKQLKGPSQESAVEQLANIPEPWLERLQDENLAYVALGYDEDLADTELIRNYTPERLRTDASQAGEVVAKAEASIDEELAEIENSDASEVSKAFALRQRPEQLSEKLSQSLQEAGLGFAVKVTRDLTPLSYIEQEFGVEADSYDEFLEPEETERGLFRDIFLQLNGPGVVKEQGDKAGFPIADDAILDPENDILLIPYVKSGAKRLSPVSKENYSLINGREMDQHHGAHYWLNRLIVLDDQVVDLPSPIKGHHSVLLHETGHAMDYLAEEIPELNHRETMDRMYSEDLQRLREGGENRFLTSRARDNAREYFAEAVEAYLTAPVEGESGAKVDNHHQALKEKNPELYGYVDKVMRLQLSSGGGES